MKLVQLLREIETEIDFEDNPVYLRKKVQRDLQQYLAQSSKAVLELKPAPIKVLDIPAQKVDGIIKADNFTELQAITTVEYIEGLSLENCVNLKDLGELRQVSTPTLSFGYLALRGCTSLTTLGKLREVYGSLYIEGCTNLVSLGDLEHVEGDIYMRGTPAVLKEQLKERGINVRTWT
jgi:hypothetical protein